MASVLLPLMERQVPQQQPRKALAGVQLHAQRSNERQCRLARGGLPQQPISECVSLIPIQADHRFLTMHMLPPPMACSLRVLLVRS